MRALIESLQSRVRAVAGAECYFVSVPKTPSYPYVLLWTSTGALSRETLGGDSDLDDRLGVTMVHLEPDNLLILSGRVRSALVGFAPVSDTWTLEGFRDPYDSRPVEYDRDAVIPGRGYPHYAVDMYRLRGVRK